MSGTDEFGTGGYGTGDFDRAGAESVPGAPHRNPASPARGQGQGQNQGQGHGQVPGQGQGVNQNPLNDAPWLAGGAVPYAEAVFGGGGQGQGGAPGPVRPGRRNAPDPQQQPHAQQARVMAQGGQGYAEGYGPEGYVNGYGHGQGRGQGQGQGQVPAQGQGVEGRGPVPQQRYDSTPYDPAAQEQGFGDSGFTERPQPGRLGQSGQFDPRDPFDQSGYQQPAPRYDAGFEEQQFGSGQYEQAPYPVFDEPTTEFRPGPMFDEPTVRPGAPAAGPLPPQQPAQGVQGVPPQGVNSSVPGGLNGHPQPSVFTPRANAGGEGDRGSQPGASAQGQGQSQQSQGQQGPGQGLGGPQRPTAPGPGTWTAAPATPPAQPQQAPGQPHPGQQPAATQPTPSVSGIPRVPSPSPSASSQSLAAQPPAGPAAAANPGSAPGPVRGDSPRRPDGYAGAPIPPRAPLPDEPLPGPQPLPTRPPRAERQAQGIPSAASSAMRESLTPPRRTAAAPPPEQPPVPQQQPQQSQTQQPQPPQQQEPTPQQAAQPPSSPRQAGQSQHVQGQPVQEQSSNDLSSERLRSVAPVPAPRAAAAEPSAQTPAPVAQPTVAQPPVAQPTVPAPRPNRSGSFDALLDEPELEEAGAEGDVDELIVPWSAADQEQAIAEAVAAEAAAIAETPQTARTQAVAPVQGPPRAEAQQPVQTQAAAQTQAQVQAPAPAQAQTQAPAQEQVQAPVQAQPSVQQAPVQPQQVPFRAPAQAQAPVQPVAQEQAPAAAAVVPNVPASAVAASPVSAPVAPTSAVPTSPAPSSSVPAAAVPAPRGTRRRVAEAAGAVAQGGPGRSAVSESASAPVSAMASAMPEAAQGRTPVVAGSRTVASRPVAGVRRTAASGTAASGSATMQAEPPHARSYQHPGAGIGSGGGPNLPVSSGGPNPDSRLRAPAYEDDALAAVYRVIHERRDVRNDFLPDEVPTETLTRILDAAHTAPSVGFSQPWDFLVIRDEAMRQSVHDLAARQRRAYAASLPKARARAFAALKTEAILDTPVNIVVTCDPTRGGRYTLGRYTQPLMAPFSSCLAVENLWLAARAEGLGVGWVSFFDERELAAVLDLPDHLQVVAYLCVGYVASFPQEPELAGAGWAKRRPLSWAVHEERFGHRALPGAEPISLLNETVDAIRGLDPEAVAAARDRQARMTKPPGSLGALEAVSEQLSGLAGICPPPLPEPAALAVFAGDHGVHAQGVTPWPQEVTAQMVANFLAGGAVVNAFAKQVGAEVCVVDVGVNADLKTQSGLIPRKVRYGTGDMTEGPALTREEVVLALEAGIETARDLVAAGNRCLLTGDMGIANTTASAALIAAFTGASPAQVTGYGTGIDEQTYAHKVEVVGRALALHQPDPQDPIGVLAAFGGLEHAALAGFILGASALRIPVVLDGVIAGAAALVAQALSPEVTAACVAGHRSAEPGHALALEALGISPLIDLELRLGEGSGAALALPLVGAAVRALREVATFDDAGVADASDAVVVPPTERERT